MAGRPKNESWTALETCYAVQNGLSSWDETTKVTVYI